VKDSRSLQWKNPIADLMNWYWSTHRGWKLHFHTGGRTFWNSLEIDLDYNQSKKFISIGLQLKENDTVAIGDTIDIRMREKKIRRQRPLCIISVSPRQEVQTKSYYCTNERIWTGKISGIFQGYRRHRPNSKDSNQLLDAEGNLYTKTLGKEKKDFLWKWSHCIDWFKRCIQIGKICRNGFSFRSKGLNEQARRKITGILSIPLLT